MYYPVGWQRILKIDLDEKTDCASTVTCPYHILSVESNIDRELFLILTNKSIHIWFSKPALEIVCHRRSAKSIEEFGLNVSAVWRFDLSSRKGTIVVSTNRDQLLFYQVRSRNPSLNVNFKIKGINRKDVDISTVPTLTVYLDGKLDFSDFGISCLLAAGQRVIVASLKYGDIHGVLWDGSADNNFPWTLKKAYSQNEDGSSRTDQLYVKGMKYSSAHGGFSLVFSTGKVAFLPVSNSINYASGIDNATCTEVNNKFGLIAYGLDNSQVIVCNIKDQFPVVNHRLVLSSNRFPDAVKKTGPITNLNYTPDNHALVTVWHQGGFAMWSVFGSLLFTTLSWEASTNSSMIYSKISSLSWGREGYNLWMVSDQQSEHTSEELNYTKTHLIVPLTNGNRNMVKARRKLTTFSFAKAALINSPHITSVSESVLLLSEDRLYIGHSDPKLDSWDMIQLPQSYVNKNFPIRYATIDRFGNNISIAGKYGFATYSLINSKWKLFDNDTQERDFMVCGEMIWWFDYIVIPCHNLNNNQYEIRAYSSRRRYDNTATITPISKKMVLMSIFENRLLGLYSNGDMEMFLLNLRQIHQQQASFIKILQNTRYSDIITDNYTLEIVPFDNLVVSNLKAKCMTSLTLTRLHFENDRTDDSILINACGKLFLLERESPSELSKSIPTRVFATSMHFAAASIENSANSNHCAATFKVVSYLATNVEHYWICPDISNPHSPAHYLTKSLWMLSGGQCGHLRVWLPLLRNSRQLHQYLACTCIDEVDERIMLPVKCNLYPLSILFNAAIIIGAENESTSNCFSIINRRSQVYLHRILRELLKRQLGCHALEIGKSYDHLAYFAHTFELLLHEVLEEEFEEETSSPTPLSNRLLPMIVKFIEKFPKVYLETVVHCARKSELDMWPLLFSEVGNPRRLFQQCLKEDKLDTAASCLIILQSLKKDDEFKVERNTISHQMVSDLLSAAKKNSSFHYLLKDLECFLERAQLTHNIEVDNKQV